LPEYATDWAQRVADALPVYDVVLAADSAAARREIAYADVAYGVVPSDLLPLAKKLSWLQIPLAGPKKGFYYPELIAHPVEPTHKPLLATEADCILELAPTVCLQ
jgi:hypothetical protein